jgi:small GTP-binding protein
MDFTNLEKKGLVRAFNLSQSLKRDSQQLRTITILFDERDDAIFYKYNEDFSNDFSQFIDLLTRNQTKITTEYDYTKELRELYNNINETVEKLSKLEHPYKNSQEFPASPISGKEPSYFFKIIVVGDPEVGKTSTILRYTDNAFQRSYISTIGANLSIKDNLYEGELIELILYDLAGQAKYSAIREQFYQKTNAILIIFDLTNKISFESVSKWYDDLRKSLPTFADIPLILCGNKCDLQNQIVVSEEMANNYAKQINVPYFEISALTGKNNAMIFQTIVEACWKKMNQKKTH